MTDPAGNLRQVALILSDRALSRHRASLLAWPGSLLMVASAESPVEPFAHPHHQFLTPLPGERPGRLTHRALLRAHQIGCTHALWLGDEAHGFLPHCLAWLENQLASELPGQVLLVGPKTAVSLYPIPLMLRLLTGQQIANPESSCRLYPLKAFPQIKTRSTGRAYPLELLVRLAWQGVAVEQAEVGEVELAAFKPLRFWPHCGVLSWLFFRQLLPRRGGAKTPTLAMGKWWQWQSWKNLLAKAFGSSTSDEELALAVGLGVFIGVLPIFGAQTLLAFYLGHRLHLSLPMVILGTQISLPPLTVIWPFLSLHLGHWLLHGRFHDLTWQQLTRFGLHDYLGVLGTMGLGSLPVASLVAGILALSLWAGLQLRRRSLKQSR